MAERNTPTVEDLKAPLLAAVGAADLALERLNEIVTTLRERAEEARTDASSRVEETRERISKLQEDLPARAEELRGRLSSDELRKTAESYREQVTDLYNELIERGEAALERLRNQPGWEERRARAARGRAARLIGGEPKAAKKAAAKKPPAKKTAAKKAPAKKAGKKVTQK